MPHCGIRVKGFFNSFWEKIYSGCKKNVPVFKRFFLQPLMPNFRISEHYYGKRYKLITI
jgi:hypothetical protein